MSNRPASLSGRGRRNLTSRCSATSTTCRSSLALPLLGRIPEGASALDARGVRSDAPSSGSVRRMVAVTTVPRVPVRLGHVVRPRPGPGASSAGRPGYIRPRERSDRRAPIVERELENVGSLRVCAATDAGQQRHRDARRESDRWSPGHFSAEWSQPPSRRFEPLLAHTFDHWPHGSPRWQRVDLVAGYASEAPAQV